MTVRINITITPGQKPFLDPKKVEAYLQQVTKAAKNIAVAGLNRKSYPPESSPGQYPARRTGGLAASVHQEASGFRGKLSAGEISSGGGAAVADWLEHGTPKGQMKPRPYLQRSLRQSLNVRRKVDFITWR